MKNIIIISIILIFIGNLSSCGTKSADKQQNNDTIANSEAEIAVYYFHYSIRCEACVAVEDETRRILKTMYPDEIKKGIFSFQSINLDKENSKTLAEKYQIGGQTLIFVKNGKVAKDLTNEAFMYASLNPPLFEDKVKETMIKLIN